MTFLSKSTIIYIKLRIVEKDCFSFKIALVCYNDLEDSHPAAILEIRYP